MKEEHLKQLARLAIETQDKALMIRALELLSGPEQQEIKPKIEVKPQPVIKPDPHSVMAMAVRNLLAAWRPYEKSSASNGLQTRHLEHQVLSKISSEDMKALFPRYRRTDSGASRGWAIEEGLGDINRGLHTHKIICIHGKGRRFVLKRIM